MTDPATVASVASVAAGIVTCSATLTACCGLKARQIGQLLKATFDPTAELPLPDGFEALLDKLEDHGAQHAAPDVGAGAAGAGGRDDRGGDRAVD